MAEGFEAFRAASPLPGRLLHSVPQLDRIINNAGGMLTNFAGMGAERSAFVAELIYKATSMATKETARLDLTRLYAQAGTSPVVAGAEHGIAQPVASRVKVADANQLPVPSPFTRA